MKKIISVLVALMLVAALTIPALAVSGSVSLSASASTLYGGDTFTVTAKLSSSDAIAMGTVLLSYDTSVFEMTGGSIKNNTAGGLGGGVYLAGTNAVIGGDAVITDNTAGGKASNVYLPAGTTFKAQDLTEKADIGFLLEKEPGTVASAGEQGLGPFPKGA